MSPRLRLLLVDLPPARLNGTLNGAEVEAMPDEPTHVAERLRAGGIDAIVVSAEGAARMLDRVRRDELVLTHIDKGLAVLDPGGTVVWANPAFAATALGDGDPVGKSFFDALGGARVVAPDPLASPAADPTDPLAPARAGRPLSFRLHCPDSPGRPYLEADVRPVPDSDPPRLVAVIRNVTAEVVQRQKLDALHAAGRELGALDRDQLSEMNTPTRVELLKLNLRKLIHDLLRYDTIEVRVLDRRTSELRPLLEDGMTPEAAGRVLFARPTGNGVTGHVAYTGVSYLCADAGADPLYIRGAEGARSSMTVPIKVQDEVIGTLNVESPRVNAFGPDDLQFTELFSREVAAALHTLDLLTAQEECTASQSIAAVNKEIALPIDEVLASASLLIGKAFADPETAAHLRKILDNARLVKESVGRVGREMTPRVVVVAAPSDEHRVLDLSAPPPAVPDATPLVGRRVLVVDPDERVRRQAHLLLTRLGATVETAGTATAGLALAGDTSYDAVFMDVKPPDMGGYDCYRRFKAARPTSTLALTTGFGYDVAHSIVKARQDGLRYVLFKPFRQEQVVTAVLDAPAGA
ncbi:response regulator [bacterium]|nr:response regulator [bacterium]